MSSGTTRTKTGHFTPELFTFLRALKRNNKREWFERNKPRYIEHVRDPMLHFIADFAPKLQRISPHVVADPRPTGGSMFRIYRDVRFSKDKLPYKTAATAQFRHERGKDVHAPGYYLHLGTDGVYVGTGIWRPDADALRNIRQAIVDKPKEWKRIVSAKPFKDGRLEPHGDSLKRPPKGFDPEHPLIEDLKRKDYVTFTTLDEETACAPDFLDTYTKTCRSAGPYVKFIADALGLEW